MQPFNGGTFLQNYSPLTMKKYCRFFIPGAVVKRYDNVILPGAYENLLLDVLSGKNELFVSDDELRASWDILMPVLDYLESKKIEPEDYPFGTNGPEIFQTK